MEVSYIISIVTFFVTLILGTVTKKHPKISNKVIPIQNLAIGVIVTIIEWIITKDFKAAILLSGVMAGGVYDICHNLIQIIKGDE